MPERKDWERRSEETDKAFASFCAYLEAGPNRTVTSAYRARYGEKRGTQVPGFFRTWAERFEWKERASAWEDYLWSETLAKREHRIERLRQRLLDKGERFLDALEAIAEGESEPKSQDQAKTALALLSIVGLDKPERIKRVEHTGRDGGPIETAVSAKASTVSAEEANEILRAAKDVPGALEAILGLSAPVDDDPPEP
jgi:hypothetical protein